MLKYQDVQIIVKQIGVARCLVGGLSGTGTIVECRFYGVRVVRGRSWHGGGVRLSSDGHLSLLPPHRTPPAHGFFTSANSNTVLYSASLTFPTTGSQRTASHIRASAPATHNLYFFAHLTVQLFLDS